MCGESLKSRGHLVKSRFKTIFASIEIRNERNTEMNKTRKFKTKITTEWIIYTSLFSKCASQM